MTTLYALASLAGTHLFVRSALDRHLAFLAASRALQRATAKGGRIEAVLAELVSESFKRTTAPAAGEEPLWLDLHWDFWLLTGGGRRFEVRLASGPLAGEVLTATDRPHLLAGPVQPEGWPIDRELMLLVSRRGEMAWPDAFAFDDEGELCSIGALEIEPAQFSSPADLAHAKKRLVECGFEVI